MNKNKFKSISNFISRKGLHTIRVKLSTIQWLSGKLNDDSHGNLLKKTNTSTPLEQKKILSGPVQNNISLQGTEES
jgi:hypothetical protein